MINKNLEEFAKMLKEEMGKTQRIEKTSVGKYSESIAEESTEVTRWKDPISKKDQEFVTLQQMNQHYALFLSRIQQQLSSLGGGGEVNFRYLDDTDRSTMKPENDNWVLEYDANTKKVKFTDEIGPITHILFNTQHEAGDETVGTVCWNNEDDTLNVFHPNGVVQQVGQELYAYVRNNTGVTITNGTVVSFSGAEQNGTSRLEVSPFLADGTYPSLYTLGIATEDISDGADGRIAVWGKTRGVDASGGGTTPTETWNVGDILYAHPSAAGKLTKVKPTSPNNVVPVAAVLRNDSNVGELFVRPTVEQRYDYGTFSSTETQTVPTANQGYGITFNTEQNNQGIYIDVNNPTRIAVSQSGLYTINFNVQALSNNSSAKNLFFWIRKNGVDIPFTNRTLTVVGNAVYTTLHVAFNVSLQATDYVELMWASTDTNVELHSSSESAFAPSSPSVYLHIDQTVL